MARTPKPWYRSERKAWFVTINCKRYNLGPNKSEAEKKFYQLMASPIQPDKITLYELMDDFLEWTQKHRAERTYTFYKHHLNRFAAENKDMECSDMRPFHAQRWLDSKEWGGTYKGAFVRTLKRCFNWGVRQGYLTHNPIRFLDKPKENHRDTPVTREEYDIIFKHTMNTDSFHDVVVFSWETGARPQETLRFTGSQFDEKNKRIVMENPKARGPRWRIIHLNDTAFEVVKRNPRPKGPVFRNRLGAPWTSNACSLRFGRIQNKVGRRVALYDFRHAYGTDMLKAGVDPVTVAELMGHTDVKMLMQVYQHLSQDIDYMQQKVQLRR